MVSLTCVLRVTGVVTSFLERLVVYGVSKAPAAVKATQSGGAAVNLEFAFDKDAQVLWPDHVVPRAPTRLGCWGLRFLFSR